MKPGDGSTGSSSGTQVAYATVGESLTPRARDLEDGIEPRLGTRGQGLQEALATQARVPRDLRHSERGRCRRAQAAPVPAFRSPALLVVPHCADLVADLGAERRQAGYEEAKHRSGEDLDRGLNRQWIQPGRGGGKRQVRHLPCQDRGRGIRGVEGRGCRESPTGRREPQTGTASNGHYIPSILSLSCVSTGLLPNQVRRMAFANSLPVTVLLLAVGAWSVVPTPGTYRIVRS